MTVGLNSVRVMIAMKKEEKAELVKRASEAGLTLSAYMRYMAFKDDKQN